MRRQTVLQYAVGVLGVLLMLLVWQLVAMGGAAGSTLPSATDAIGALIELLVAPQLWSELWVTLLMALSGLLLAVAAGVLVGVAIGTSPLAMHASRVPLEFLKPIPPIVILPVAVLVLGPTANMGVVLVVIGCFVSITVQSAAGVFDTDPVAKATGRSYGMSSAEIMGRIVIPNAMPYIGTSIRVAAPIALVVAVVAGLLGGGPGLGQSLLLAQLAGNRPQVFAYVLILGILGLVIQGVSQWAERRALHWHPQYRKDAR